MTDLELTKACAEAMGYAVLGEYPDPRDYNPLHNDTQAMALVKKLKLSIYRTWQEGEWQVNSEGAWSFAKNLDLNRAIVECVAKLGAKQELRSSVK